MHKQGIRRVFHGQLKQLWRTNRFLRDYKEHPRLFAKSPPLSESSGMWGSNPDEQFPLVELVAALHQAQGYRFVPLVRRDWSMLCTLEILFLRRDAPGSALNAGDIDNRIKTLIDALRCPLNAKELAGSETPLEGEDPFFVLMEDDSLVSHFSVETDTLLDPPVPGAADTRRAKVVVTVDMRPYHVTLFNSSFL
jgi:hypothetical protein